ncbi:hypothetical protein E3A20_11410, partial [Planctomyces bekefii]
ESLACRKYSAEDSPQMEIFSST